MTPKEKAKELTQLFAQELIDLTDNEDLLNSRIKQCVFIAVDEILNAIDWHDEQYSASKQLFWLEVKFQIEQL